MRIPEHGTSSHLIQTIGCWLSMTRAQTCPRQELLVRDRRLATGQLEHACSCLRRPPADRFTHARHNGIFAFSISSGSVASVCPSAGTVSSPFGLQLSPFSKRAVRSVLPVSLRC